MRDCSRLSMGTIAFSIMRERGSREGCRERVRYRLVPSVFSNVKIPVKQNFVELAVYWTMVINCYNDYHVVAVSK